MASFNQVVLLGNLVRDPELRYTQQGAAVCDFGLAVSRRFTRRGGEKSDEVTFVNVTVWSKLAEVCAEFLAKGRPVLVSGRLVQDRWEEESTGQKRSKLRVVGESVQFLSQGSKDDAASAEPAPSEEAPAAAEAEREEGLSKASRRME